METEFFTDKEGRLIRLEFDDSGTVEAFDGDVLVGHFSWDEVCIDSPKYGDDKYAALLTNIFLDKAPGYTNSGIGTAIVQMIKDYTENPVAVCRDNGTTRSDGAHPTGAAPGFYCSLVNKKLAFWYG